MASQPTGQSAQPESQPIVQPAGPPVSQQTNQPDNPPASKPARPGHTASQPRRQTASQPTIQPASQPTSQTKQFASQPAITNCLAFPRWWAVVLGIELLWPSMPFAAFVKKYDTLQPVQTSWSLHSGGRWFSDLDFLAPTCPLTMALKGGQGREGQSREGQCRQGSAVQGRAEQGTAGHTRVQQVRTGHSSARQNIKKKLLMVRWSEE